MPVAVINNHLQVWIGLATKILVVIGALLALLFAYGKIIGTDGLVFSELEVPEEFNKQGYTGKLLSRQFAQKILESKQDVPKKLTFLFASDRVGEERSRLEKNIEKNYNSEQKEVELSVGMGLFDLPLDNVFDSLRNILGTNPVKVVGILADQNGSLFYNVGLIDSEKGTHYYTFHQEYNPDKKYTGQLSEDESLHGSLLILIDKAARFVLEKYDPLVLVLEDYSAAVTYSSSKNSWCVKNSLKDKNKTCHFEEFERISILESIVEDEERDSQYKQIAYALLGDIYERKNQFGKAIKYFELAIDIGEEIAITVGIKLANRYLYEAYTNQDYRTKAEKLLLTMLDLDPEGRLPFVRLLALYDIETQVANSQPPPVPASAYDLVIQRYQDLIELATNRQERISTYKGLSDVLAWQALASNSHDSLLTHLEKAFSTGIRLHNHDLRFPPYSRFNDLSDINKLRKKHISKYPVDSDNMGSHKRITKLLSSDSFNEESKQVVVVINSDRTDIDTKIHTYEKIENKWQLVFAEMHGSVGRNGLSYVGAKREGDGMAPAGIFSLDTAFGYQSSVSTNMEYTQVTDNHFWIDDINSPKYNQLVVTEHGDEPKHEIAETNKIVKSSNERLKRSDHLYEYAIVIGYNKEVDKFHNDENDKKVGKGSAIFIHWERAPGAPTSGCVATSRENMLDLLKWLDPDKKPMIVMGASEDFATGFPNSNL